MNVFPVTSKIFVNRDTERKLKDGYKSYLASAVGIENLAGYHVFYVVNSEEEGERIGSLMGTGQDFRESLSLLRSKDTTGILHEKEVNQLYWYLHGHQMSGVDWQCKNALLYRLRSSFGLDLKPSEQSIEPIIRELSGMEDLLKEDEVQEIAEEALKETLDELRDEGIELAEDSTDELDHTADEYVTPELTEEEQSIAVDAETGEVSNQTETK